MATESQTDFSGGLNTRSPAHLIGANQLTELQNVDLSHNDLRGEYGTKAGGESEFYYEAASAWVSAAGFSAAETILDWPFKFTGTGTVSLVASGTSSKIIFTSANHGLSDEDIVQFSTTGSLPTNISASTNYYVNDKTADTFYVEPSVGGGNVTYSSTGSGTLTWAGAFTGGNEIDIVANVNYFSGSPNAIIGDGTTIEIGSNITVSIFAKTQGIHGANSYVEYNDDLYITRSSFSITADSTDDSDVLTTGTDTNKLQIGDELVNTDNVNTGSYIKSINTTNSTVTLNAPAIATASAETYTVDAIISKYVDGATGVSYRSGVNQPQPVIEYAQQTVSDYITNRDGTHSDAWYGANDPIPFQYGVAEYDETGVESTMGEMTDSNIGTVGGDKFPVASGNVDEPQYISISGLDKYSSSTTTKGRFALYRVGGTSAFIKRCDNLFLDSDLTVLTVASGSGLTVTLGTAKNAFQYKVKWYTYNQGSAAKYRYYNSDTGYVYPFDALPGSGTVYRAFSGETEYKNAVSTAQTFVLDGSASAHFVDIIVMMKIPGELIEREYVCRAITHAGGTDNTFASGTGVDYIDFNRADALADIQPIEEVTTPVKNLNGLIESSNLFYAFKDNRLHVSDYGNPNSWPKSGFIDFDQDITGLGTLGSELVVFSEYGMYRVFGTDPSLLKKVQIPTTEGVKAGANKTITKFQSGILFAGLNGLCFYDGQKVNRMTQNNLSTFALPDSTATNNHGGYLEDAYYLLGTSGTGYKLDLKGIPMLSRTTQNASNLFFRGSDNTLYADTGTISDPTGTRQNFTATTRKFAGTDINMEKLFYSVTLTAQSFTGTINVLVDGTQTDTFSVGTEVVDLDRTFYCGGARQGNGLQVQLSSCTGQVNKISVNYDDSNSLTESLFASVKIKYIGTPTVAVTLDGVANIAATTLSAPTGVAGEATLYFLAMSTGIVPHLKETNNESAGRVLDYQYTSTGV